MGILDGKVVVITGGSRGLGLGMALEMARAGASVVIASRSPKSVDEAVRLVCDRGGKAIGMAVDVADLSQVEKLAELALQEYGRLDIWVNNAGISAPYGPTLGVQPRAFSQVVQTNIVGVYHGSRVAVQHFTRQGSGKLINVIGRGSNGPVPWQNAYASSKAWVRSFTQSLAAETKGTGVGIFAYNPGMMLTEMLTDVDVIEGSEERLKVFPTIVRMWALPVEVSAKKAVWIASSATDGKTGLLINIMSPWMMLRGALKEGLRVLMKKSAPGEAIRVRTVPYDPQYD